MLINLKTLHGTRLAALDGDIGQVKDFYFDDQRWVIRYLVADTGTWLTGKRVLLTPHVFGRIEERDGKVMLINLTRQQIENCPSPEAHQPVSRQYEVEYYKYYGWPAYWTGGAMWGFGSYPLTSPPARVDSAAQQPYHNREDAHLRSALALNGYHIQTTDGPIGQVSSLLVDDRSWAVRKLIVEAGHWYAGKEILIAPSKVQRISYEESTVFVSLTKEDIQQAPEAKAVAGGPESPR